MIKNYFTSPYWSNLETLNANEKLLAPNELNCGVCETYRIHRNGNEDFKK
ncbi:MAG: hypothetical protein ACFFDF_21790 [Candidatus Odinarchaeota archaeon]